MSRPGQVVICGDGAPLEIALARVLASEGNAPESMSHLADFRPMTGNTLIMRLDTSASLTALRMRQDHHVRPDDALCLCEHSTNRTEEMLEKLRRLAAHIPVSLVWYRATAAAFLDCREEIQTVGEGQIDVVTLARGVVSCLKRLTSDGFSEHTLVGSGS